MDVRRSYDHAAAGYTEHLLSELNQKPLDRHLLNRFAEDVRGRGVVADLGCGPGHVARYLHDQGVHVAGIDLSPEMIACASAHHRGPHFSVGDMTALAVQSGRLAGIVSFYSIVHFDSAALSAVGREFRRVLAPGGLALIAFHIGAGIVHLDELFGASVDLDFHFHSPATVVTTLSAAHLKTIERVEREPYEGAEYPSRRCYLLARAQGAV
jgi:SAM-dependent methyltransferase